MRQYLCGLLPGRDGRRPPVGKAALDAPPSTRYNHRAPAWNNALRLDRCMMTETTSSAPAAAPRQGINWRRMLTVWVLLAASMTVVAVVGWAILPQSGAAPGPGGGVSAMDTLTQVINPKDMAPSRPWRFIIIHHAARRPDCNEIGYPGGP